MEIPAFPPEIIQDINPASAIDSIPADVINPTFNNCIDLISASLNSRILSTSDEFFAPATNLISPHAPIKRPGVYIPTGAWYDGWETRRHNPSLFDWVIIKLGVAAGRPRGVEIDTAFFDGNHAPAVAVQGCYETGEVADGKVMAEGYAGWREVLGRRDCGPNRRQAWHVSAGESDDTVTHVRLLMFPDGGIARFRLYGHAVPFFPSPNITAEGEPTQPEIELSAAVMGGVCIACSDERFGKGANLLLPGRGKDMGDGWETRRSRAEGHVDWVVVKLVVRGLVKRVVVDTKHFRGNFPRAVRIQAANLEEEAKEGELLGEGGKDGGRWVELVGEQRLGPDAEHEFFLSDDGELNHSPSETAGDGGSKRGYTHVKMTIIPDGGVKRLRVFGVQA